MSREVTLASRSVVRIKQYTKDKFSQVSHHQRLEQRPLILVIMSKNNTLRNS